MALIRCPDCRFQMSDMAGACPRCGCRLTAADIAAIHAAMDAEAKRRASLKRWGLAGFAGVALALAILIIHAEGDRPATPTHPLVADVPGVAGSGSDIRMYLDAPALSRMSRAGIVASLRASGVWAAVEDDLGGGGIHLTARDGTRGFIAIYRGRPIYMLLNLPEQRPVDVGMLRMLGVTAPNPPDQEWPVGVRWTHGFGRYAEAMVNVNTVELKLASQATVKRWEAEE